MAARILFMTCILFLAGSLLVGCAPRQPASTAADSDFMGKEWVAEYILGAPVIDMSHSSIQLNEDGSVTGNGGCNAYTGSYTLEGNILTFGPMAATMKMCAEALSDQEMRFFQSLAAPLTIKMENGLLNLVPAKGKPSVFAIQN